MFITCWLVGWIATLLMYYVIVITPAKVLLRKEADKRIDHKFTALINDEWGRFWGLSGGLLIGWILVVPVIIFWPKHALNLYVEAIIDYYDKRRA